MKRYSAVDRARPIVFWRFLSLEDLDETLTYKTSFNTTSGDHQSQWNNFHGCSLSPAVGKKSEIWNFYSRFGHRAEPHWRMTGLHRDPAFVTAVLVWEFLFAGRTCRTLNVCLCGYTASWHTVRYGLAEFSAVLLTLPLCAPTQKASISNGSRITHWHLPWGLVCRPEGTLKWTMRRVLC